MKQNKQKKEEKTIKMMQEVPNSYTPVVSKCCKATMRLGGGDEGTFYYICQNCDKACDMYSANIPRQRPKNE